MNLQSKDFPNNETKKSNESSNESSLQLPMHGEAVPPAPSMCDAPSVVAPSTCNALSVCDSITVGNPPQAQLIPMRVTQLAPNPLVNWK